MGRVLELGGLASSNLSGDKEYAMSCVNPRQLQFLEYLIWRSRDASEFAKKALICMVRKSEGLSREVRLSLSENAKEVMFGLHHMSSEGLTTHIDQLIHLAGSDLSVDCGGIALRFFKNGVHDFRELNPSSDEINAIVPADPYKR